MILHLFPDEKFIDGAIDAFEHVYPNKNKYLVGLTDDNIRYIKKYIDIVLIAPIGSQKYQDYIGDITKYEAVVIHYLDDQKLKIIKNAPIGVNFVWISWGGDVYNRLSSWRYKLYGKATEIAITKSTSRNIYYFIIKKSFPYRLFQNIKAELKLELFRRVIRKINYFSTVLLPEKNIVQKHYQIRGSYVPFNYSNPDSLNAHYHEKFNLNKTGSNNNILLGNSAAPTNNHIEAINFLSKFELGETKVIIPLSYGANHNYINNIKEHGEKVLGKNFFPLNSMLQLDEYHKLISSCSVCIMNHYRQNGMGNVIFMIWIGTKVFLSERNPAYSYFKKLGVHIYSIENDLKKVNDGDIFNSLPHIAKIQNRRIMEECFSYDIMLKRTDNFINIISSTLTDSK